MKKKINKYLPGLIIIAIFIGLLFLPSSISYWLLFVILVAGIILQTLSLSSLLKEKTPTEAIQRAVKYVEHLKKHRKRECLFLAVEMIALILLSKDHP